MSITDYFPVINIITTDENKIDFIFDLLVENATTEERKEECKNIFNDEEMCELIEEEMEYVCELIDVDAYNREKRIERGVGTKLFVDGWDKDGKLTFTKEFSEEYYDACIQLPKSPPSPTLKQSLLSPKNK